MVGITTYTSLSSSRVTGSSTSATAQPVAADDKTGATTSTGSTGTSSTVETLNEGAVEVIRFTADIAGSPKVFLRVKVTKTP